MASIDLKSDVANAVALAADVGVDEPVDTEELAFVESPRNTTIEVRNSVSRAIQSTFPRPIARLLEAFVTYVSGCAHTGQKPLFERSTLQYVIEGYGGYIGAIWLGHWAFVNHHWWLLPIAWLLLCGRGWALFSLFHQATHNNMFGSKRLNYFLSHVTTIITFGSSIESYYKSHVTSHHTRALCTYEDGEDAWMELGFWPGKPKKTYWRRLWLLALSPWSHIIYLKYRLWDWPRQDPWYRQVIARLFLVGLVGGAYWANMLDSLLWAYVVPMFLLFNITGLLGTFSEHHWGCLIGKRTPRERHVLLSQARFCLDPAPDPSLPLARRVGGWTVWWLRFLFYHLPVRVAVLPSDSIHHDHHHRHPFKDKWQRSTYERAEHIENGCPGFEEMPHRQAWSMGEAIDRCFERMSKAPPPPPEILEQKAKRRRVSLPRFSGHEPPPVQWTPPKAPAIGGTDHVP